MRTREIGVRVAIGASRRAVIALIVGQACRWTLIGAAAGILLSLGVTRLLAGVLYGVSPTDPATYGAVALLLVTVAALAAWLPALQSDPRRSAGRAERGVENAAGSRFAGSRRSDLGGTRG